MPLHLDYFYGGEAEQYSFYRVPKVLFTDSHYKTISVEAKVLYGLLLDRMALSVRNGWFDSDNRVFIYFTLEDTVELLGCGKDKAVKLFKELDQDGGIGLIERKKQGQGRPTKIYVKNFTLPPEPGQTSETPKPALLDSAEVLTSEKPKSGLRETRSLDFGKSASNKTDKNNTELNDTDPSIYPPQASVESTKQQSKKDRIDSMDTYRELIKENIDYDVLLIDHPYDEETIEGYVELMVEVCCSQREFIRINREEIPTEVVKSRMLKLNKEHISYVLDSMQKNTTLVGNIKAYTLSALYNAPVTISQYYTSPVSHDMAQGFGGS